ncbi:unnamed protein product [Cyprideis torosa]|uniref:Uncharacterized protein n=1 Tax=Cyprideis torosa TaxID=163714 RepID=A0A7R8WP62_9CRUS|nr:unnamed protein product [Cyprideis torosa]CAG0901428.1 unnamed protein product [Cyprideis torosa]
MCGGGFYPEVWLSVIRDLQRGEISNFQYLMHLNTLAGRSYNDLMQYPVFPWILSDYVSDELDLANPRSFRDLSKPMGAQTPDRLEQFRKRYVEWDDPTGETPPYHYGTHYSSAMIVCSFLVRMEPFTQHFLKLQGGHFDLPDRMFHSVNDSWMSASKTNMADVKELIPEFFYLPDFLLNNNNFDLGAKQSGIRLHHVLLPPWAKGDAKEFIRMHRQVLGPRHSSLIDPGPVIQGFVGLLGGERLFYHHVETLRPTLQPVKELKGPVGQIIPLEKSVAAVEQNKVLIPPLFSRTFAWGYADQSLRIGNYENEKASFISEPQLSGEVLTATCPNGKIIITGGTNTAVHVWEYTKKNLVLCETLYGHSETVTSLAASSPFQLIVSGSRDGTCILWDLSRLRFIRQLEPHLAPVAAIAINDATGNVATCAGTWLYFWTVSGDPIASVNTEQAEIPRPLQDKPISGRPQQILCVTFSTLNEWDPQNVIMTGSSDGVVRVSHSFSTLNEWDPQNVIMTGSSDGVVRHLRSVLALNLSSTKTSGRRWDLVGNMNGGNINDIYTRDLMQVQGLHLEGVLTSMEEEDEIAMETTADASSVHNSISADPDDSVRRARRRSSVVSELQSHLGSTLPGLLVGAEEGSSVSAPATVAGTPLSPKMPQPPTIQEEFDPPPEKASFASDSDDVESEPEEDRARRPRGSLVRTPVSTRAIWRPDTGAAIRWWRSPEESSMKGVGLSDSEFDSVEGDDSYVLPSSGGRKTGTSQPIGVPRKDPTEWKTHCPPSPPDHADLALGVGKMRLSTSFQEGIQPPDEPHSRRQSDAVPQVNVIAAADDSADARAETGAAQTLKNSKSESCLADSHATTADSEILGKEKSSTVKDYHQRRDSKLREGFRWEPRLSFRGKLTMHTAYGRRDNAEPASITALAVSRDHRCVYVGDSRGRVFSWCVYDQAQRPGASWADHWVRNEMADACCGCNVKFSFTIRRHHCRNCGQVFCLSCSQNRSEISRLRIPKPVRVCQRCFRDLQALSR